jgi:hypothetical protein
MINIALRDWKLYCALLEFGHAVIEARKQTSRRETWYVPYADRQPLNAMFWKKYDMGGEP